MRQEIALNVLNFSACSCLTAERVQHIPDSKTDKSKLTSSDTQKYIIQDQYNL